MRESEPQQGHFPTRFTNSGTSGRGQAHSAAAKQAAAIAYKEGNESAVAEIEARVPNYPVAQLLYAYALENLLKGIIVAKEPALISDKKLNGRLKNHNLAELARQANFMLHLQEVSIAEALSSLSTWAGRYPVALYKEDFASCPDPDALLDYGSRNHIMRTLFNRCHGELIAFLSNPVPRNGLVVVFRQPGTENISPFGDE